MGDSSRGLRVGITGHQGLSEGVIRYVSREIMDRLAAYSEFVGISSLAEGADQLFAECVLAVGGSLEVIVPSNDYRSTFKDQAVEAEYDHLLNLARKVSTLAFPAPSEEAFLAAGRVIVDACDILFAVWDGAPARGSGGTADIVEYARSLQRSTVVIWPKGVVRTSPGEQRMKGPSD